MIRAASFLVWQEAAAVTTFLYRYCICCYLLYSMAAFFRAWIDGIAYEF